MIVISVGKRVEGDAFLDSQADMTSVYPVGQLVNARMVYSLTVGRLAWTYENLAETYNATCGSDDDCRGIRFQLEKTNGSSTADHLLINYDSVPLSLLSPLSLNLNWFQLRASQWKNLASTVEEAKGVSLKTETRTEPVIFPRNFKTVNSTLPAQMQDANGSSFCELIVSKRLDLIEKNHLYIEHTLQPAYTAGLYFIFQNGVVFKELPSNATDFPTKTSLAFSGNRQDMYIQASIPMTNVSLAIAGCFIMVVGGALIAMLGIHSNHILGKAGLAAEAIANREKFPPLMLRLRLRDGISNNLVDVSLDTLFVEKLVLVETTGQNQAFTISHSNNISVYIGTFESNESNTAMLQRGSNAQQFLLRSSTSK
ncbi:unnamed protein product [Phytophthora fragariaefolia]|uniref:Unnamed protein product n=1 Tax=Phytophthora fragariaefolia TaxID=1490495 RepID=A0A9W6TTN1_9STRA|nr:unnamed protein product [Phytophthora fragariaefolia]